MLRWGNNNWPYSSCYTEPDLRFLVAKSKSLSFNRERFVTNSSWMGCCIDPIDRKHADHIESKYGNVERNAKHVGDIQWWGLSGTRLSDQNSEPFFYRLPSRINNGCEFVAFTIRAIFAGRVDNKICNSLRESCEAKCLVCNAPIIHERDQFYDNRINGGVILVTDNRSSWDDNTHRRYEIICNDCHSKWKGYHRNANADGWDEINRSHILFTEELISFTRFFLKHNKEISHEKSTPAEQGGAWQTHGRHKYL